MKTLKSLFTATASIALITAVFSGSVLARDIDAEKVTVVHSGDTGSHHTTIQCHFRTQTSGWINIAKSDAADFNCGIVMAAYLSGDVVSVDHTSGNEVEFLCVTKSGAC